MRTVILILLASFAVALFYTMAENILENRREKAESLKVEIKHLEKDVERLEEELEYLQDNLFKGVNIDGVGER